MLEVTAGDRPVHQLTVTQEGDVVPDGKGQLVLGLGGTQPKYRPQLLAVAQVSPGPVTLTTTRGAGALSVAVTGGSSSALPFTSHLYVHDLPAHATQRILVFFGHATMTLRPLHVDQHSDDARVTRVVGDRVDTLDDVEPQDNGVGIAAGPAAASATTSRSLTSPSGLVGTFVLPALLDDGTATTGTWSGPNGRGTFIDAGPVVATASFAGPAGAWSWHWEGAAHGYLTAPAVLIYLPVGAHWHDFAGV